LENDQTNGGFLTHIYVKVCGRGDKKYNKNQFPPGVKVASVGGEPRNTLCVCPFLDCGLILDF
jgi:hypothetical protein